MLPVFNKPTIQYVVEEAVNSGIDDIIIITGKGKDLLKITLTNHLNWNTI